MAVRNFDDTLEVIGSSGRYQAFIMLLTGLAFLVVGAQNMAAVFTAGVPAFTCAAHDDVIANNTIVYNATSNETLTTESDDGLRSDETCEATVNGSTGKCTEWRYSKDVYDTSIVTEAS